MGADTILSYLMPAADIVIGLRVLFWQSVRGMRKDEVRGQECPRHTCVFNLFPAPRLSLAAW
jgi:hypothetical protein